MLCVAWDMDGILPWFEVECVNSSLTAASSSSLRLSV